MKVMLNFSIASYLFIMIIDGPEKPTHSQKKMINFVPKLVNHKMRPHFIRFKCTFAMEIKAFLYAFGRFSCGTRIQDRITCVCVIRTAS